ncbi:MAG: hypothetical protein A2V96_01190 [Candidatus Yonathbacteria bacterium RBG_16_43_6]|nr:MAG: hypothetical protein A2V96_01190 [Candidatus Yonathbacteria bacterium RBG_16_43_6]
MLFYVPNLYILILAFNLIARPVAVVIRFIFLRMMFGGVSLSAVGTEGQASQNEVEFLPSAGIAVMFGHNQLDTFP